jgi:hypothetical protein
MNTPKLHTLILESIGASSVTSEEVLQELWSGYGTIKRLRLEGPKFQSVIVKHIRLEKSKSHPRGWNTDISHKRKLKSYKIESHWYEEYSSISQARLPHCISVIDQGQEFIIIMEDLDAAGYQIRKTSPSWGEITNCLQWLARFHATYMGKEPKALWTVGTYWHLATRPNELEALKDQRLKAAAAKIDSILNSCKYKTIVHGDAKLANFCFGQDGQVAAVDFQYVGGGCGMKDVAYFIGSVLESSGCEELEEEILDTYFYHLQKELPEVNAGLEAEWRSMYRIAWADFHRFLKGWSPDHWKNNDYSERITKEVIDRL